ncbi:helix-turn-helix transcriptional regulator [Streptomyces sp. ISL-100]|uniref:helix-turn-helix domain-containing protein n=1 Tax=Streptomyces sp. ISL-100 TaxID=2819173 RepID=UPI001BEB0FE6|nr:helix-turn-helix transcriptional regulator [Streptomyces sp. ISL-100]MBT2398715.1 helix-turn-helix transcriptional regulator [Streptomyces sp. ISL-100]
MALRRIVSERQRRFGSELRSLREQACVTLGDAAAATGMKRPFLSHIEAGRTAITTERLHTLCEMYGHKGGPYVEALVGMSEATGKGWWSAYKGRVAQSVMDLAEMESTAVSLHLHESLVIPGLFQVSGYTQAILDTARPVRSTIDDVTAFRMDRQQILTAANAPAVHAVIYEAALHMHQGGPDAMRTQLLHLVELAKLPNVTIQIYPFQAGAYPAFSGPFLHAAPAVPRLGTVVLEHPIKPIHLGGEEHLAQYSSLFEQLTRHALPPIDPSAAPESHSGKDSLGLIQHVLYTL